MVFMVIFMVPDPWSISSKRARKGARSARSADNPLEKFRGPVPGPKRAKNTQKVDFPGLEGSYGRNAR